MQCFKHEPQLRKESFCGFLYRLHKLPDNADTKILWLEQYYPFSSTKKLIQWLERYYQFSSTEKLICLFVVTFPRQKAVRQKIIRASLKTLFGVFSTQSLSSNAIANYVKNIKH